VKHETTASGMADAYGRLTGRPGVVLVTAGPGATNSLTGVAQAYTSAAPLIHISGAVPRDAPYESFHSADKPDFLVRLFAEVTKWSVAIERPEDIPAIFARAFALATSGRPGPVHIEIPQDVLLADAPAIPPYARQTIPPVPLADDELARMVALIRGSRRPLIWAGKGVRATATDAALVELAELLEAPVILSGDAAGALPDTHPLSTGQLALYAQTPLQQGLAREADLILAIGERAGTGHAGAIFAATGAPVAGIWLGDAGEAADPRAVAGAVADLPTALDRLLEACGDQRRPIDPALRGRIARGKDGLREHIRAGRRRDYGQARPMHYGLALDADTIVLGDIGSHNQWTRLAVRTLNRTTFVPEGYWGAMGFGLPAALAAKLAYPQKKVNRGDRRRLLPDGERGLRHGGRGGAQPDHPDPQRPPVRDDRRDAGGCLRSGDADGAGRPGLRGLRPFFRGRRGADRRAGRTPGGARTRPRQPDDLRHRRHLRLSLLALRSGARGGGTRLSHIGAIGSGTRLRR